MINMLRKVFKFTIIFILIFAWFFSGWPQIFNFPPKIQEVFAEIEVKKSTLYTDADTSWTNPGQCYDTATAGDETTEGNIYNAIDADPDITFHTWQTKGQTYTATTLKVKWKTSGGFSVDRFGIQYTKNGGTNWTDPVVLGVHNETTIQVATVSLDVNQDLTQVQVKVLQDRVGGADKDYVYIYDIWTEGTYAPTPADPVIGSSTHTDGAKSNVANATFTATAGAPTPDHYHYLWDQTASHSNAEVSAGTQWDGTLLNKTCASDGDWYLHAISHNTSHGESTNTDIFHIDYNGTAPQVNPVATVQNSTAIRIVYNEAVKHVSASNSDDALNPDNYSILPSLAVSSVAYVSGDTTFDLTTAGQTPSQSYTITVTNIEDEYGNVIDPANDEATFTGYTAATLTFSISDTAIGFGSLNTSAPRFATGNEPYGSDSETSAHTLDVSISNASGYSITVKGDTLKYSSYEVTAIGGTALDVSVGGAEQFGIRLTVSGGGSIVGPYDGVSNYYAYVATATTEDEVASFSGASDTSTFSVYYAANIAATTEVGTYTSVLTYICTGN